MTMHEIDRRRGVANAILAEHRALRAALGPAATLSSAEALRQAREHVEAALREWWAQDCREVE